MKRIISALLVLLMLVSLVPTTVFATGFDEKYSKTEEIINEKYIEEMLSSYQNKADIFSYTNYLARHYTSDNVKGFIEYRINEDTNCNNLVEYLENDTWFNVAYSEWVLASLITDPVDTLNKSIHAETYYETVIFNIIDAAVTSENAIDWLNQGAIKNSVKILNSMTKCAETDYYAYLSNKNILISELTDEQYDKMMEFTTNYVNSQNFKIIGTDLSFLSDVLSMSKDIEEYSERLASYCQLFALGDEIADFLETVKNNTYDYYLIKSIEYIIPIIRDSYNSMLITAAKDGIECIGTIALKKIVGDSWKKALIKLLNGGVLLDGTAIINASLLALSIGKNITNIAFSIDEKMDQYEIMRALCSFETAMEKSIYDILNNYQNTEAYSNLVLAGVSIVYQTYITDAEIYSEIVTICQKDWGSNLVEDELNKVLEISNHNKQIYQTEYDSLKPISGLCGDMLGWVITPDDELIIYGVGAIYDFEETTSPWYSYGDSIITVYLSSYVTAVGSFAFKDSSSICTPVVLMDNVTLNSNAFNNVTATIICKGDLKLNGNHIVNGPLYVEGDFYGTQIIVEEKAKIFVGKQFTLDGTINTSGNLYVYGEIDVKGDFQANDLTNIFDYGVVNVGGNANFIATSRRFWDTIGYIYIYSDASFGVGGDLTLKGSWFSNVHTQWFILYLYGELIVEGDFSASNRFVAINQKTLDALFVVKGDFYLSVLNQTWIGGFDVGCKGYECSFTAGTLILGGNYNNESTVAFRNSHTTVLNGVGKQNISGLNASNLTIANTSSSGVCFSGNSFVTGNLNSNTSKLVDGKNLYINGGKIIGNILNGDISVQGDFTFTNDLIICGILYAVETVATQISVPEGTSVTIEGDASFQTKNASTTVRVKDGGELIILGNLTLKGKDRNPSFYYSNLYIDGRLSVGGNLSCSSCYRFNQNGENSQTDVLGNLTFEENGWSYSYKNITAGVVAVKGRVHNYEATNNNVLLLNGSSAQRVSADSVYTHKFGTVASTIVIDNTKGVYFDAIVTASKLFDHKGSAFTLYNNGTNSVFVDYDGDGLKDNADPHPTIHENCIDGHEYGDWQIQIEQTPNVDGLRYRICTECGNRVEETIPSISKLFFSGASLTLHDNISINFKANESLFTEVGYENPYVVYELNGEEFIVSDYEVVSGKYVFDFADIAPNNMNDTVKATLYATFDGVEYVSETREYSVATYCYNMLNKYTTAEYAELQTLLVDLLNYGAMSQIYTSYKTDDLVNANLTDAQKAWGTSETPTYETVQNVAYKTIDNPTVTWKGGGLNLVDAVTMRFKITADSGSYENLVVKAETDDRIWTIPYETFTETTGGYYVYFSGLNAGEMSEPVYLTVYENGEAVSNTLSYSIESYAYSKQTSTDTNLVNLLEAMMKYGNSAYAYAN